MINSYRNNYRMSNCKSSLMLWYLARPFAYLLVLFLICEYFIYYLVIIQCTWPEIKSGDSHFIGKSSDKPLKVALIADTHLLGKRGHWFDKLRREWQMYRSFQTMTTLHDPKVVFFLGDLFDEGLWSDDIEFSYYVKRFHSLFETPTTTKVYVVVGNHDIGFHYRIHPTINNRFVDAFSAPPVNMLTIDGNVFVLLNSMAMEGDGCYLCSEAQEQLQNIAVALKCSKSQSSSVECKQHSLNLPKYTKPVLLQHFPMYRPSDMICDGPDAASPQEKRIAFREKWECLSKESSNLLFRLIEPRLIFGGHTHHGCLVMHNSTIPEWSVPSFSWRNRNNPSFLLVTMTADVFVVEKCFLPQESTVIFLYIFGMALPVVLLAFLKIRNNVGWHIKRR